MFTPREPALLIVWDASSVNKIHAIEQLKL